MTKTITDYWTTAVDGDGTRVPAAGCALASAG